MKFKLFIFALNLSIISFSLPFETMHYSRFLDNTNLGDAVKAGYTTQVKSCLMRGDNPNITITYYTRPTPLIFAVENGHLDIVKPLLDYHANVNAQDTKLWTALHYAALWNLSTIVNILLKSGANINLKDENGRTALYYAHNFCVELLLKHINHILDQTDNPEICQKWDQYVLDALNEIKPDHLFSIDTINAFRIFLHHADKLPLSRKKLESLTAQTLGQRESGEEAFRKTIEHIRKNAF